MKLRRCWLLVLELLISLKGTNTHEIGIHRTESIPAVGVLVNQENCFQNQRGHFTQTGRRLEELREAFDSVGIDAYIITTEDFHQRPFASPHNKRLFAVSGFSGDFGVAVITRTEAVLWTDGRHFNQAVKETGCNWILHRKGGPNVPSVTRWIKDYFANSTKANIGASPHYISSAWWRNFEMIFSKAGLTLKAMEPELVDMVWTKDRPKEIFTDINVLPLKFSGKSWQEKLKDIHAAMKKQHTDVLITTGIDENAWLFNMRALDTGFDPYFYSLSIIDMVQNKTRLYIGRHLDQLTRKTNNSSILDHLNTGLDGTCQYKTGLCVEVLEYDYMDFISDIRTASADNSVSKVWISPDVNYAVFSAIPKEERHCAALQNGWSSGIFYTKK